MEREAELEKEKRKMKEESEKAPDRSRSNRCSAFAGLCQITTIVWDGIALLGAAMRSLHNVASDHLQARFQVQRCSAYGLLNLITN
jgi:hypothetical protein